MSPSAAAATAAVAICRRAEVNDRITIYRYGHAAWFWRFLIGFFLAGGVGSLLLGVRLWEPWLFCSAVALLGPALFFGTVLGVRVDRSGRERVHVLTLLFWWRRFEIGELGSPRIRKEYHDENGVLHAPRVWVSVRRRLPIYLDLLGQIPDQTAFGVTFSIPISSLPERGGS